MLKVASLITQVCLRCGAINNHQTQPGLGKGSPKCIARQSEDVARSQ